MRENAVNSSDIIISYRNYEQADVWDVCVSLGPMVEDLFVRLSASFVDS